MNHDGASSPINLMVVGRRAVWQRVAGPLLTRPGVELLGSTADAGTVVAQVIASRIDVVLMDINLAAGSSTVIRAIASAAPEVGVVVLAGVPDDPRIVSALAAGASGCLTDDPSSDEVEAAIRAVVRGEPAISPAVTRQVVRHVRERLDGDVATAGLTARELDVLRLLARGWDNARIGEALYLGRGTVKHHISSILTKLDVDNRVQAAVRAVRGGLVDDY